jgi:hypothetical protein
MRVARPPLHLKSAHALISGRVRESGLNVNLLAADTIGAPKEFNAVKTMLGRGVGITAEEFADLDVPLLERLRPVAAR